MVWPERPGRGAAWADHRQAPYLYPASLNFQSQQYVKYNQLFVSQVRRLSFTQEVKPFVQGRASKDRTQGPTQDSSPLNIGELHPSALKAPLTQKVLGTWHSGDFRGLQKESLWLALLTTPQAALNLSPQFQF